MEQQVNNLAEGSAQEPMPKSNAGWFRRGDARINREGRPRGSKAGSRHASPGDVAPSADRVKLLFVPGLDLAFRLTQQHAPWIVNLPGEFEFVGCRVDPARGGLLFTIRSQVFPWIAKGTLIPEFTPQFNGLIWRRRR